MVDVTAALLRDGARILIARRNPGGHLAGLWEFPGGKIEPGETPEQCLQRELKEELGFDTEIGDFFCFTEYDYGDRIIRLHVYHARWLSGSLVLTAHDRAKWVTVGEMENHDFPPADKPVIEALIKKSEIP